MMVKNITFTWEITGENNGENTSEVRAFGHYARILKSYDNNKWSVIVDQRGKRGLLNEEAAKAEAEAQICAKIEARYQKAKADLALFDREQLVFDSEEQRT